MSEHIEHHIKHLQEEHSKLDKTIAGRESTGVFEDDALTEMKKQRLHLKDEITRLQAQNEA